MSSSRWFEAFGRISGNMKNLHILGGTPYLYVMTASGCEAAWYNKCSTFA